MSDFCSLLDRRDFGTDCQRRNPRVWLLDDRTAPVDFAAMTKAMGRIRANNFAELEAALQATDHIRRPT